jgi:hypothetical protein
LLSAPAEERDEDLRLLEAGGGAGGGPRLIPKALDADDEDEDEESDDSDDDEVRFGMPSLLDGCCPVLQHFITF